MSVIIKKQRFRSFGWVLVFALTGASLAQVPHRQRRPITQQPTTSTADQEAEPNTANYPQRPAYTPGNPYTQPSTYPNNPYAQQPANNNQQSPQAIGSTQPVQPANPAPQVNQAKTAPMAVPHGQAIIGPPVPIPPTPEQMPPGAPKVSYQDGLLSVESVNSRLTDILNAIHNRTGIQFEGLLPGQDRVAGKFGPAPADEVLTTLLQGSRYDYVIMSGPDKPGLVERVILTPSSTAGAVAGVSPPPGGNPQAGENEEEENGGGDEPEAQEQVQAPPGPQQVQPVPQPGQNSNHTPKTTEQLLEELKQMQQRNQQRQPPTAPLKPSQPQ